MRLNPVVLARSSISNPPTDSIVRCNEVVRTSNIAASMPKYQRLAELEVFTTTIGLPLLGLALSASPWILGAACTHHFTLRKGSPSWVAPMSIGIGGYLGYLTLAGLVWACEQQAINILNPRFVYTLAAVAWLYVFFLAGSIGFRQKSRPATVVNRTSVVLPANRVMDSSWLVGGLLLTALISYSAFHHSLLPLQSWDALDLWGPQAAEIIELQSDERVFENRYYHPQTLSIILAWSAYSSALVSTATGQWPWFLSTLSVALIVFGHSRRYDQSWFISGLTAYMAAHVPLLENHSYLAGYGGIFVAVALLGACALIDTAIEGKSVSIAALGCLLAFSVVFLKNIGPFYFFVILSSYLLILSLSKSIFFGFFLITIAGAFVYYFLSAGISFQLISQRFSISPDEGQIYFAGKLLTIVSTDLLEILNILGTAIFRNNSYGIMPHILVVITLASLLHRPLMTKRLAFIQVAITLGISGIAASLYTDYGFQHAIPANDTGNSRFMLPIIMLSALLVAPFLRQLTTRASEAEH